MDVTQSTATEVPFARLKGLVVRGVVRSGLSRLMRPIFGGRGAVLALHRVRPGDDSPISPGHVLATEDLAAVLSYAVKRGLRFVSLDEIPERLGSSSRERFLAITLDDGFADNLQHAVPVFREFQAPFAVFPVIDFLNRKSDDPWMLLQSILPRVSELEIEVPHGESTVVDTSSIHAKALALETIPTMLAKESESEVLRRAAESSGVDLTRALDEDFLSWEQLKGLANDRLATIGVHTISHRVLAKLSETEAAKEIGDAKKELERQLGITVRHIAYPVGSPVACGKREFEIAAAIGLISGFTTTRGNLFARHRQHLFALPRHTISSLPHSRGTDYLQLSLDGIWDSPLNNSLVAKMRV